MEATKQAKAKAVESKPTTKGASKARSPKSGKLSPKRRPAQSTGPTTKTDQILGFLRRPKGASLAELMQVTSWQAHSVRGFLSGTVKKKLGLNVVSEKDEAYERRYRIANETRA